MMESNHHKRSWSRLAHALPLGGTYLPYRGSNLSFWVAAPLTCSLTGTYVLAHFTYLQFTLQQAESPYGISAHLVRQKFDLLFLACW